MADYNVVKLVRNRTYPTYQLFAQMDDKKTDVHDGLRLAALTCIDWLKHRLGENCPGELSCAPDPSQYKTVDDSCLSSLHLSTGFVVDIVFNKEAGEWSLQVSESDLGSNPGKKDQERQPVAGRNFHTDISFKIVEDRLFCGFRTQVNEPPTTAELARVYRLAVIRQLAEHPDFGFRQIIPLDGKKHDLTKDLLKEFLEIKNAPGNQLPLVVFVEPDDRPVKPQVLPKGKSAKKPDLSPLLKNPGSGFDLTGKKFTVGGALPLPAYDGLHSLPGDMEAKLREISQEAQRETFRFDADRFAQDMIGFCLVYDLEAAQLDRFRSLLGIDCREGDVLLVDPVCAGSGIEKLHADGKAGIDETMANLKEQCYCWPRGKAISYGPVPFLSTTRANLLESLAQAKETAMADSALSDARWQQEIDRISENAREEIDEKDEQIFQLREQVERQKQYTARVENEKTELRKLQAEELEQKNRELEEKDAEIDFLRRTLDRPDSMSGVVEWAEKHFSDHLVFDDKVRSRLSNTDLRSYDPQVSCAALDYLANEIWEVHFRHLSMDEANRRCSEKFNMPFELSPVDEITYNDRRYTNEYHISYHGISVPLDWHLKQGHGESMLRIYYCLDEENELIVIGSMPKHLSTLTFGNT